MTGSTTHSISRDEWLEIHNRAAQEYTNSAWFRETILGTARLRKRAFATARGTILDVACGDGENFAVLPTAGPIVGVDFSPVMVEKARERARRLGRPIDLHQMDAEALQFPDAHFDTVVSALATCSFLDPIAALREMRRVCRPGGQILLLEHGRSQWAWLGRYQDRTAAQMIERGGCRWNQEPQELIRAAGLRIVTARRSHLGVFHIIHAVPAQA
jgi:ubiquinone/menaquinone biosynthesis C-methylase UbiE